MPVLKHLTCNVEWQGPSLPLREYQTSYADGFVETYVPVPEIPTPFSIHLQSHGYIAPGLAMFVYIDGVYQCNRNRSNLKIPDEKISRKQAEINFRVRQKEEIMADGSFRGKQWTFKKLEIDSNGSKHCPAPFNAEYVGTIEVVVLRCYPTERPTASTPDGSTSHSEQSVPSMQPEVLNLEDSDNDATSSSSSEDESISSENNTGPMEGLLDEANEELEGFSTSMAFGGDMAWDNHAPNQGKRHPGGSTPQGSSAKVQPQQRRSNNEWDQNYDTPMSQRPAKQTNRPTRASPNNSSSRDRSNQNQNQPGQRGNTFNPYAEPQRTFQSKPPTPGRSVNLYDTSVAPPNQAKNSPAGNSANWSDHNTSWRHGPPSVSPAVIINVNHDSHQATTWERPNSSLENNNKNHFTSGDKQSFSGSSHSKGKKSPYRNASTWQDSDPAQAPEENVGEQFQTNELDWNDDGYGNNGTGVWDNGDSGWNEENNEVVDVDGTWYDNAAAPGWDNSENYGPDYNDCWDSNENNTSQSNNVGDANNGNNESQAQSWGGRVENHSAWVEPAQTYVGETQGSGNSGWKNSNPGTPGKAGPPFHSKSPNHAVKPVSPHSSQRMSTPRPSRVNNNPYAQDPPEIPPTRYDSSVAAAPQSWTTPNPDYVPVSEPELEPAWEPVPEPEWEPESADNKVSESAPQTATGTGPMLPVPIDARPKPYWLSWKQPMENDAERKPPYPPAKPAEPLYSVPVEVAERMNMSHQVHLGQPAEYVHKRASPRYMDDFQSPYAVFVFKYRSKAILEQLLNIKLSEPEEEEKRRLQGLTKEELIEQVIRAKAHSNSQESGTSSDVGRIRDFHANETVPYKANDGASHVKAFDYGGVDQKLSPTQKKGNNTSDNASTNPELIWDRVVPGQGPDPSLNHPSHHSESKVASWLGSGSGRGKGNASHGHQQPNGARTSSGGMGANAQQEQHGGADWNQYQGAGAWLNPDNQHNATAPATDKGVEQQGAFW